MQILYICHLIKAGVNHYFYVVSSILIMVIANPYWMSSLFQALCQDTLKYFILLLTPSHTGNEDLKEAYLAQGNTVFKDAEL